MRCYTHAEVEAVAICKSCGRGLCRECATETGTGITCEGVCRERVMKLDAMTVQTARAATNLRHVRKNGLVQAVFLGSFAAALLYAGFSYDEMFPRLLGTCFLAYAGYVLYRTITYPKPDESLMPKQDRG